MAAMKEVGSTRGGRQAKTRTGPIFYKFLTPALEAALAEVRTSFGGSLSDCLKSGKALPRSEIGVYATDAEAYDVFSELFDPMILHIHKLQGQLSHPPFNFGDPGNPELDLEGCDPEGRYIFSTRVRVARNLSGAPFTPSMLKKQRLAVEQKVRDALDNLPDDLKGNYRAIADMSAEEKTDLINRHLLFKDDDRYLQAAGVYQDWPAGRGIFQSHGGNLQVWVNEEDHMRIISMLKGCSLPDVYRTLIKAVTSIQGMIDFAHSDKLGYLSSCPTNLGTTLRASVHVRLPLLASLANFKAICNELNVDVRGTHGEKTEAVGAVYDISNKHRLGLSEFDALHQMVRGLRVLLMLEKGLEQMR